MSTNMPKNNTLFSRVNRPRLPHTPKLPLQLSLLVLIPFLCTPTIAEQAVNAEQLSIEDNSSERVAFGEAPTAVSERIFTELKERIPETGLAWIDEAFAFGLIDHLSETPLDAAKALCADALQADRAHVTAIKDMF